MRGRDVVWSGAMKPLAVALALELAVPPVHGAAPVDPEMSPETAVEPVAAQGEEPAIAAPLAGSAVEGPAPPPAYVTLRTGQKGGRAAAAEAAARDPNDWWYRRDRRLRNATIGLGAVAGAAFLASGIFTFASYKTRGSAEVTDDAALGSAVIGFVTLPALIGVGAGLGSLRAQGWQPAPEPTVERDPRGDPWWIARDRKLRGATIAVGVTTGVLALSLPVTYAIGDAVIDEPDCSVDCGFDVSGLGLFVVMLTEGVLTAGSAIALVGLGAALGHHRRPLRRVKMGLGAGGLLLRF